MAKVMLIMDEPKTCMDCVLCKCGACTVCECRKLDDSKFTKRADFCPLRPVLEERYFCTGEVSEYDNGYNACIDEILNQ